MEEAIKTQKYSKVDKEAKDIFNEKRNVKF